MDDNPAPYQIIAAHIQSEIEQLYGAINQVPAIIADENYADEYQFGQDLDHLQESLKIFELDVVAFVGEPNSITGLQAATSFGTLTAYASNDETFDLGVEEADIAVSFVGKARRIVARAPQAVRNAASTLVEQLKRFLMKVSKELWQLISKLITPTGWSVTGETGVSLFGFQGLVSLEISFGP